MVRLGVVGYGNRATGLIKGCFKPADPDLRVVGIVDPREKIVRERLEESDRKDARFYATLDEMVRRSKLDALLIACRCNLHTPYAIRAAHYDIPLYLEKPVAVTMKQATDLEKAFEKSRCPVVVSFPLRVSPLCELTRRYIADGAVGRPDHILGVNYVPYGTVYWEEGYRDFPVTNGLFLQKATHDLDYMMYLMDSPIVRVAAMANYGRIFGGKKPAKLKCSACGEQNTCLESPQNRRRNQSGGSLENHLCLFGKGCGSPKTGINEDCSSAVVEFASGAHGAYTQVFFSRRDSGTRGATVSGYLGTISFDWYKNFLKRVRHHDPFSDMITADAGMSHFGGDDGLTRDFFAIIRGTGKSRTSIQTGLRSVYSCLAAKESAETGRFVKVRQVGA